MPNGLECLMFYRLTEENYIQILVSSPFFVFATSLFVTQSTITQSHDLHWLCSYNPHSLTKFPSRKLCSAAWQLSQLSDIMCPSCTLKIFSKCFKEPMEKTWMQKQGKQGVDIGAHGEDLYAKAKGWTFLEAQSQTSCKCCLKAYTYS
jgi:hypothetical protein